jgi:hypothetical protein
MRRENTKLTKYTGQTLKKEKKINKVGNYKEKYCTRCKTITGKYVIKKTLD